MQFKSKFLAASSMDEGLVHRIVAEMMSVLKPGLPTPKIKFTSSQSHTLGFCRWAYGQRADGSPYCWDNTEFEIQTRVTKDEQSLRRVIFHEGCHHEDFLVNEKKEFEKYGYHTYKMFRKRQRDGGHGSGWRAVANRFNAKYGVGFVTEKSDQNTLTDDTNLRPFYVLISANSSGDKMGWQVSLRLSPKQKSYLGRCAEGGMTYSKRLFMSTDPILMKYGAPMVMYGGSSIPKTEEQQVAVRTLWGTGQDILQQFKPKVASDAASFGKTSAATESNTAFKQWFGDSKVVNEDGTPKVVYHGTTDGGFDTFKLPEGFTTMMAAQGAGFYFTDKENARQYMKKTDGRTVRNPMLYSVYLSIKNPLRITKSSKTITRDQFRDVISKGNRNWFFTNWIPFSLSNKGQTQQQLAAEDKATLIEKFADEAYRIAKINEGDCHLLAEMTRAFSGQGVIDAMEQVFGTDGVIYSDSYGHIYVAWHANQIKSATNNSGEFSTEKDSIIASKDGTKNPVPSKVASSGWKRVAKLVYHGSPFHFESFNSSKINSGEGNQTYGWGLYFAGNRETAEYYKTNLEKDRPDWSYVVNGRAITRGNPDFVPAEIAYIIQEYGPVEEDWLDRELGARLSWLDDYDDVKKRVESFTKQTIEKQSGGQIYEADIPDDDTLLDWDNSLSEQPDKVKEAIQKLPHYDDYNTGGQLYLALSSEMSSKGGAKYVSELMHSVGIKGIRYLDAGSRNEGEGTRNYVVFSDKDVKGARVVSNKTASGLDSWFNGSKVVNPDGSPKVVYHGTGADISEFSYEFTGQGNDQLGSGFYFTDSQDTASGYTERRSINDDSKPGGEQGNVMPVYLCIKKPIHVKDGVAKERDLTIPQVNKIIFSAPDLDDALTNFGDVSYEGKGVVLKRAVETYASLPLMTQLFNLANDFYPNDVKAFNEAVRKATGYDGIICTLGNQSHYVAWFPNQIKSAIGNSGAYDPNNMSVTGSAEQEVLIAGKYKVVKIVKAVQPGTRPGMGYAKGEYSYDAGYTRSVPLIVLEEVEV